MRAYSPIASITDQRRGRTARPHMHLRSFSRSGDQMYYVPLVSAEGINKQCIPDQKSGISPVLPSPQHVQLWLCLFFPELKGHIHHTAHSAAAIRCGCQPKEDTERSLRVLVSGGTTHERTCLWLSRSPALIDWRPRTEAAIHSSRCKRSAASPWSRWSILS